MATTPFIKLTTTKGSYSYLIPGAEPILVDTSFPGRSTKMLGEIRQHVDHVAAIVITHHDVDHIGNLSALQRETGARVYVPQGDAPFITGQKSRRGVKKWIALAMRVPPLEVFSVLADQDRVGDLEAVEAPGHTPGHMAFRGPGFLLVGDAMVSRHATLRIAPDWLTWNAGRARQTYLQLLLGYAGWILPAHGEPVYYDGRMVRKTAP